MFVNMVSRDLMIDIISAAGHLVAMSNEWQPIATAPKDGTVILLWDPAEVYVCCGAWMTPWTRAGVPTGEPSWHRVFWRDEWVDSESRDYPVEPTHWQPLPEPPR